MALPVGKLATASVEVNGEKIEYRSLSRKETVKMAEFRDDPDAGEVYLLMCATGSSEQEVIAFRDTTNPLEVDKLLNAIVTLSGIDQMNESKKNGSAPKV